LFFPLSIFLWQLVVLLHVPEGSFQHRSQSRFHLIIGVNYGFKEMNLSKVSQKSNAFWVQQCSAIFHMQKHIKTSGKGNIQPCIYRVALQLFELNI